jgi:aminoglycoside phosphotransferase family enzyme/predicted kinase
MTIQTRLIDGLIRALEAKGLEVTLRETHISWVLLAGDEAWKIKKAVNFGFLDFSTLAKRKHACEEELRLNRRFAPEIYLDVSRICGSASHPLINRETAAIEYAVRMQRFDEKGLLSVLADTQQLDELHIDLIAQQVAKMHLQAPVAGPATHWGEPNRVHHWMNESLEHLKKLVSEPDKARQIANIEPLCAHLFKQTRPAIQARSERGFIRECHGDLHLGNMVWIEQQLVPFDCIEFNPALRWIDVISEAAFVMMDLQDRDFPAFAWRFINRYLSITGDYAGLEVLRYYTVYRALVRAKVALLQRDEPEILETRENRLTTQYIGYANLAERWLTHYRPALILMHGLSASGKSTVATTLAEQHGCVHLRSDVERKRLHGLDPMADSFSATGSGIYSASASEKTYQRLYDLASVALNAAYPVIVDAAFLNRKQRNYFQQLAIDYRCPFLIVHCDASRKILESRIIARAQKGNDPSEATLAVLEKQIGQQDSLTENEPFITVSNTDTLTQPTTIVDYLLADSS